MGSYKALSDMDLVKHLQADDEQAFNEIFNRYYGALYIHAFKRLQHREECRDLVQDLLATLWQKRAQLKLTDTLSGYLYMAVRNRIFDLLAKKRVNKAYIASIHKFAMENNVTADALIRQNQLAAIIDGEIAALPPRTREIFELSRKGFLSHKEIAERLDISEQTVKTTVNNALKTLRVKLGSMLFISF